MDFDRNLKRLLARSIADVNPRREELIRATIGRGEAEVSASGALATWTPPESTGRSPADTVIVRRTESEGTIDWDSPNNLAIGEETFDRIRSIRPDARVILSSGFSEQEATLRFEGKGLLGFLQKPYRQSALLEKLREVTED